VNPEEERIHMLRRTSLAALAVGALALTAAGCGSSSSSSSSSSGGGTAVASSLVGAGSTFAAPLYQKLAGDFAASAQIQVNYQAVGSGAGITQFTAKSVDFGATDAPMSDKELAAAVAAGGQVVHVPTALGAVVAIYNVSGVTGLKLDGPTLANIFQGKVAKWSDPAIAALNPGVTLPDQAITTVHRADKSGTSYVFTGYLSAVSPDWKSAVGQDKQPTWPGGVGSPKNDGVAATVKQTDGSIGYVELTYALKNALTFADLKNAAGEFVTASLASTTAAAKGAQYPADLRFSLLDSASPGAYPIVSATWIIAWADPQKAGQAPDKARAEVKWLDYVLGAGQASEAALSYAQLPDDLLALAKQAAGQIKAP
jgi:phosphate transport system substrate-binding protein